MIIVAAAVTSDGPYNVTATVNTNVTLTCAIDTADIAEKNWENWSIRWTRDRRNPQTLVTLFNGNEVYPKLSRIKVHVDEETGYSELMLYNVQHKDAGKYWCKLTSPGRVHTVNSFTLTVIG